MCVHHSRVHAWVLDRTIRYARLLPYRRRVIGAASGRIMEIGIGSGLIGAVADAPAILIGEGRRTMRWNGTAFRSSGP